MCAPPRALALAALLAAGSMVRAARAEPEPPADAVVAETLFREGRALLEAGEASKACGKLADSYRLDPRLGTLMNLAACHEMEGRIATAWAEFLEASRKARARTTPESAKLEETARARAAQLEPRLHTVKLTIELPASDLAIALDSKEVPPAAWTTPFPVDPGRHSLEAQRPGHIPRTIDFEVPAEPGRSTVRVPTLVRGSAATEPTTTTTSPGPARAESSRLRSPVFWSAAAVSLTSTSLGVFFGLRAMSEKDARDAQCIPAGCSAEGLARQSDAFDAARTSTAFVVVGGIAAAVAIAFLLWPTSTRPLARSGLSSALSR
jgi:hypothetical protein